MEGPVMGLTNLMDQFWEEHLLWSHIGTKIHLCLTKTRVSSKGQLFTDICGLNRNDDVT